MNIKTSSSLRLLLSAAVTVAAGHATQAPAAELRTNLDRVGAILPVAEFRMDSPSREALSARASRLATLVGGGTELSAVATGKASEREVKESSDRADFMVESAKRIAIHFDPQRNELLAVHGAVSDDYMSTTDVGAERAHAVFEGAIKSLKSDKLVAPEGLASEAVHTGRIMLGEMGQDREVVNRVKAYFFEVPRTVNGIEVFGSSTTIAVHHSGEIESIRSIGPGVLGTKVTFKRRLSVESLTERAHKENPGAEVLRIGLRYPWDAVRGDVALASRPREAFRVVPVTTVDGRKVEGRSHYVFYAVDDKGLAPIVWPKANPNATGDTRK